MAEAALNGAVVELPLPASAKALIRFQPGRAADADELPDAPVYLIRTPTPDLNSAILMDQATAGIVRVTPQHFRDAVLIGLEDAHATTQADGTLLVDDETYARYCEVYDAFLELEAWDVEKDGPVPRERKVLEARFRTLQDFIAEISPRYQALLARSVQNMLREKEIVCRHVLAGWEQRDGLCVIENGRATAATVQQLSDVDRLAIAAFYPTAGALTEAQKKTSASSSPSPSNPSASPSASSGRRTARRGKSVTTSTEPTPDT
jgi:hypothetical protein